MSEPSKPVEYRLVKRRHREGPSYYALRIEVAPWATEEEKAKAVRIQRKFSGRITTYASIAERRQRGQSTLQIAQQENRYILSLIEFAAELYPDPLSDKLLAMAHRRLRHLTPGTPKKEARDTPSIDAVFNAVRTGNANSMLSDEYFVTAKDIENRLAQWEKVWRTIDVEEGT